MKCPNCGRTDHEPGAKFCHKCGAPLTDNQIISEPPKPAIKSPIINNLINNMVRIEGGVFSMGATQEQGSKVLIEREKPSHLVTLSSYSIGRYQVTQEEWEEVMGSNPSEFKGAKHPVESVSWEDCQEFIKRLNTMTGLRFRLPTEAEWEFAARGGNKSETFKYSGSDIIDEVAWFYKKETHDVAQKQPNELGLFDMSGNVWEWCNDWYEEYSPSFQVNPKGPTSGSERVIRGGSWYSLRGYCRVSYRGFSSPEKRDSGYGLRLAL